LDESTDLLAERLKNSMELPFRVSPAQVYVHELLLQDDHELSNRR
jgi:hypothetical protein